MASLKDLKDRLTGKPSENKPTTTPTKKLPSPQTSKDSTLELEEARYLLALIAKSDFSGKDVQVVYNIAVKLQSIIKQNLDQTDGIS